MRWPRAVWQPVAQHSGTLRPIAVTLHHQAGNGNPAPIYAARGVSAHFWIPRAGEPVQHVDTAHRAWHGGTEGLNGNCIGVETEGCASPPHADPLNEHQLNLFAELMAWAHQAHGIPLLLSETATTPGLNYHRCQGGFPTACPCDVRLNARPEILRRAGGQTTTTPDQPAQEDNMVATDPTTNGIWVVKPDGAVLAYDGAPFLGGSNGAKFGTAGKPCVGIAARNGPGGVGYVTVHRWGNDDYRRYFFPRDGSGK